MLPDLNARGSTATSTADTGASVELLAATDPRWLEAVLADFPAFLRDHASCEKKASGMALAMAAHYPDRPVLLAAMADLAAEELGHYREVVRLLVERDLQPGADVRDPYVNALNAEVRRGSMEYLLDRLLVGAVVERRGAERFGLVADAHPEPGLRKFYRAIAASEGRHWQTFLELAVHECPDQDVAGRLNTLLVREADIVGALPVRAALH